MMEEKIHKIPERISEAQKVLQQMVKDNKKLSAMPKPFSSLYVVISDNQKKSLFSVPVPNNLKNVIKEHVFVVPKIFINQ